MGLGEREQMAIGQVEPLILFERESGRVAMNRVAEDHHFLGSARAVESPREQIRTHRLLQPAPGSVAVLPRPSIARIGVTQRRGVDVVEPGEKKIWLAGARSQWWPLRFVSVKNAYWPCDAAAASDPSNILRSSVIDIVCMIR